MSSGYYHKLFFMKLFHFFILSLNAKFLPAVFSDKNVIICTTYLRGFLYFNVKLNMQMLVIKMIDLLVSS